MKIFSSYKITGLVIISLAACSTPEEEHSASICLDEIDAIASIQTFREAISTAENCCQIYNTDVKLNLRLAELYLLTYLVDNDEEGIKKADQLFEFILNIDSTFSSNHQDFNLSRKELKELGDNVPNPFGSTTRISYVLPQDKTNAYLRINDLLGHELKMIKLNPNNEFIDLYMGRYAHGSYMYSLVIDGEVVKSKLMIITN